MHHNHDQPTSYYPIPWHIVLDFFRPAFLPNFARLKSSRDPSVPSRPVSSLHSELIPHGGVA